MDTLTKMHRAKVRRNLKIVARVIRDNYRRPERQAMVVMYQALYRELLESQARLDS